MVTGDRIYGRFWSKVCIRDDTECWPWIGTTARGYGNFTIKYKPIGAHRFAYEMLIGPIPDGLVIDHLCRNRACCNPAHMEPVTQRENLRRGENWIAARMAQTHCKKGHLLDRVVQTTQGPKRQCRICHNVSALASYYRLKAAR